MTLMTALGSGESAENARDIEPMRSTWPAVVTNEIRTADIGRILQAIELSEKRTEDWHAELATRARGLVSDSPYRLPRSVTETAPVVAKFDVTWEDMRG